MPAFLYDLRYAARMLIRKPGFTAVVVLTLALGIGANTVIFSVVNAVLLRPLPHVDSQRLVMVWETRPRLNRVRNPVSFPDHLDWRAGNQAFERMAAYAPAGFNLTGSGDPERIAGAAVAPDLFPLLRAPAVSGRTFLRSGVRVRMSGHSPLSCRAEACAGARRGREGDSRTIEMGDGDPVVRLETGNGPVNIDSGEATAVK